VGKPEGRRPLERPRRRWENYTEMDVTEVVGGGGDTRLDWIDLPRGRDRWRAHVKALMNLLVP
jgi:hypothetical protein